MDHCNTFILLFFSHAVVNVLVCLGSLSCCMTQFCPSSSSWIEGFTFNTLVYVEFTINSLTARFPGHVAAKQTQIITPPPLCLKVCVRCWCWCNVFGSVWNKFTNMGPWERLKTSDKGLCSLLCGKNRQWYPHRLVAGGLGWCQNGELRDLWPKFRFYMPSCLTKDA